MKAALSGSGWAKAHIVNMGLRDWHRDTRKEIQKYLSEKGYYNGEIDAQIGASTKQSFEAYLENNK